MERLFRFLSMWVSVLLVGSCIYDYTPPVPEGEERLVVNGDILIGEMTEIRISRTTEIGSELAGTIAVDAVYVEGSDGAVFKGSQKEDSAYEIDTRNAPDNAEYRLVIETKGRTYESEWQSVLIASAIDSISYSIAEDAQTMSIEVSSSANAGSDNRFYRWIARQTWEYHAASRPVEYYVPPGGMTYEGEVSPSGGIYSYPYQADDNYFCWMSAEVSDLLLGSTLNLNENKFIRHVLYTLECHEPRTQYLYSVQLIQEAIPETAWRYYEAVRSNSSNVGGLFSPQPSEVRGNLHNRAVPEEWIIGYVCVTKPSVLRHFIYMDEIGFHRINRDWDLVTDTKVSEKNWLLYWKTGYLVSHVEDDGVYWAPRRCLDCRTRGGTKDKPSWWPNDH